MSLTPEERAELEATRKEIAELKGLLAEEPKPVERALGKFAQFAGEAEPGKPWRPNAAELAMVKAGKPLTPADLLHVRADGDEYVKAVQDAADKVYLCNTLINGMAKANPTVRAYEDPRSWVCTQELNRLLEYGATHLKAISWSGDPGFMPTEWSDQLIPHIIVEPNVANSLMQFNVPAADFVLPVQQQPVVPYYGMKADLDAGELLPPIKPGSEHVTFSTDFFGARVIIQEKASEASIVPLVSYVQQLIAEGIRWGEDAIALNGDTDATHMDSSVVAADDVRHMRNGLRKAAITGGWIVDVQAGSASFGPSSLGNIRLQMLPRYRANRADLLWITSDAVTNAIQVNANFANYQTVYGIGEALATNPTGKLPRIQGSDILVSPMFSEHMDASGYDVGTVTVPMTSDESGSGTLGAMLLLNRRAWAWARHGGIRSEVEWRPQRRQFILSAVEYIDLQPLFTGQANVAYGHNIPQTV